MPFVIDASIAACWIFPDEQDERAAKAYAMLPDDSALVPPIWWLEMRNIFLTAERRKRIDKTQATRALALLSSLPIRRDDRTEEAALMALARRHGLSAYDASYLELAQREGLALATLDAKLLRAARDERVGIIGEDA